MVSNKVVIGIKAAVHLACLLPLAWLVYGAYYNDLGANPIEVITHSTGTWTLVFLLITLSVTPLRRLPRLYWLIRVRRMLGLYAFFYACLHFTTYIWLDREFIWPEIPPDIVKRPFITIGFLGFVLLIPLALTSTKAAVRLLTGRRWQLLHRLVYLSAVCGVIHYLWLVKADITQPAIYGVILALLLSYRLIAKLSSRLPARQAVKS
jgi:methionine sulfoxide reductase heme-binding subunit